MHVYYILYILGVFLATALCVGLAAYAWRRRDVKGAKAFALVAATGGAWYTMIFLEMLSGSPGALLFAVKIEYIFISAMPLVTLNFALHYTGHDDWLTRPRLAILLIVPVLTVLFKWTDEYHYLVWRGYHLHPSGFFLLQEVDHGPWFWVFAAYAYLLLLLSSGLVLHTLLTSNRMIRGQAVVILIGTFMPLASNALYLFRLSLMPYVDLTPLGFALGSVALAWGLFQYRLFELSPVARNAMVDTMADGFIVLDEFERLVDLNPAALDILGSRFEQVVGQPAGQVLNPWHNLVKEYDTFAGARPEITLEYDGKRRHYSLRVSTLRNKKQKRTGRLIVLRDITERRRAEEALRDSEEQYRDLFENANDLIQSVGRDGRFLYVNQTWRETLGYSQDEVNDLLYSDVIHPRYHQFCEQQFENVITGGTMENAQVEFLAKNGRIVVVEGSVNCRFKNGKPWATRGIFRDITQRRQVEERLLQRNRQLELLHRVGQTVNASLEVDHVLVTLLEETRRLLDVTACLIWLVDTDTNQLVCRQATNPVGSSMRGQRLDAGIGLTGWVAQNARSLLVSDALSDDRFNLNNNDQIAGYSRSVLGVPLKVKNRVMGVLEAVDEEPGRFQPGDVGLMESLAATASVAIENARLYEQTYQDAQTKAALVDEIDHRVKNNLSAVVGLLHVVQSHMEENNPAVPVIDSFIQRVQGLASLNRILSAFGWQSLPLDELVSRVIPGSLQTLPILPATSVKVASCPVMVGPDQAYNLALIINELVRNSLAWAGQEQEEIHISVSFEIDGQVIELNYRDDGPGYPLSVLTGDENGVGLFLAHNTARQQLRGELSLGNDGGAVATIRFKKEAAFL